MSAFQIEGATGDRSRRLGVCVTVVLAITAFNLVLSNKVPSCHSLTLMEEYMIFVQLFSFSIVAAVALVGDDGTDAALRQGFWVLWGVAHLAVMLHAYLLHRSELKKLDEP